MSKYIAVSNVRLEDCCRQSLAQIEDKQQLGSLLNTVLALTPFPLIFASTGRYAAAETLINVGQFEWEQWAKAVQGVPAIVHSVCRDIAAFEVLKHPGGPLNAFWMNMHNSF